MMLSEYTAADVYSYDIQLPARIVIALTLPHNLPILTMPNSQVEY